MAIRIGESKEDFLKRERIRDRKRYEKRKLSRLDYNLNIQKKYRSEQVVYTHTNSKGDMYIGSGGKYRPYNLKVRSAKWFEFFKNDCKINIIKECKTKEEARQLESKMIQSIGLKNLVNQKL